MYNDLDVTKNIQQIERLKARLLTELAALFEAMAVSGGDGERRTELLAEMMTDIYRLARRIGISYDTLDERMLTRLRVLFLDAAEEDAAELSLLLKHLNRVKNPVGKRGDASNEANGESGYRSC